MGVSKNSGFPPQIIHFNRVFHYKSSLLGCPYFWKHPYRRKKVTALKISSWKSGNATCFTEIASSPVHTAIVQTAICFKQKTVFRGVNCRYFLEHHTTKLMGNNPPNLCEKNPPLSSRRHPSPREPRQKNSPLRIRWIRYQNWVVCWVVC